MKIKAIVTALVLGSSSLALAAPGYAPTVRDHRQPAPLHTPAPAPAAKPYFGATWQRPVLLANNTRVNGRALINVSSANRAFTKLELKAQTGRTDIDRVLITFANGQRQVVTLTGRQQGLINANKSVTIDLAGGARNIKSVMLIGSSARRASIDVVAV